ncbi:hypothetical protein QUF54_00785 [Candidatus Marithioploca araucensis]|uniref:Uncharacterized protein n=1 Tax=Candidatus Marithioploca araucensis TaxID=70273 RepID=A0ABT7VQE6_9GAMM|nr:hypothetical protein [Candidatus Marithioploca araucensis]
MLYTESVYNLTLEKLMKKILFGLLFVGVSVAHAEDYTVDFYTTNPSLVEGDAIVLDGIRVNGLGITPEDAAKVKYIFNRETFNFDIDMSSIVVYRGVGVYHEYHMVKDVPARIINVKGKDVETRQPLFFANLETQTGKKGEEVIVPPGAPLNAGTIYGFTTAAGTPFVANYHFEIGHVMSFDISGAKQDLTYRFTGPNTDVEGEIKSRASLFTKPIKILTAGDYQLSISPSTPGESVTFKLKGFNANSQAMKDLKYGENKVSAKFAAKTWGYAKYKVWLDLEDTLNVPGVKQLREKDNKNWQKLNNTNQYLTFKLVDTSSHVVAYADNFEDLNFTHEEAKSQIYTLFIYSQVGNGGQYSAPDKKVVEITNPTKPKPAKPAKPKPKPKPTTPETTPEESTPPETGPEVTPPDVVAPDETISPEPEVVEEIPEEEV